MVDGDVVTWASFACETCSDISRSSNVFQGVETKK